MEKYSDWKQLKLLPVSLSSGTVRYQYRTREVVPARECHLVLVPVLYMSV